MDAENVRNMYSNIAVTNKHTAKLHRVGSLYILTYDARKLKHKITVLYFIIYYRFIHCQKMKQPISKGACDLLNIELINRVWY
jgi:hypothetical protein